MKAHTLLLFSLALGAACGGRRIEEQSLAVGGWESLYDDGQLDYLVNNFEPWGLWRHACQEPAPCISNQMPQTICQDASGQVDLTLPDCQDNGVDPNCPPADPNSQTFFVCETFDNATLNGESGACDPSTRTCSGTTTLIYAYEWGTGLPQYIDIAVNGAGPTVRTNLETYEWGSGIELARASNPWASYMLSDYCYGYSVPQPGYQGWVYAVPRHVIDDDLRAGSIASTVAFDADFRVMPYDPVYLRAGRFELNAVYDDQMLLQAYSEYSWPLEARASLTWEGGNDNAYDGLYQFTDEGKALDNVILKGCAGVTGVAGLEDPGCVLEQ